MVIANCDTTRLLKLARLLLLSCALLIVASACGADNDQSEASEGASEPTADTSTATESEAERPTEMTSSSDDDLAQTAGGIVSVFPIDYPDIKSLTWRSDLIVRGRVTEVQEPFIVQPGEPPMEDQDPEMFEPTVYTDFIADVDDLYRGHVDSQVTVRQMGGAVDDYVWDVPDSPEVSEGDELVLFLAEGDEADVYWIAGTYQGFWPVSDDGQVQDEIERYDPVVLDELPATLSAILDRTPPESVRNSMISLDEAPKGEALQ